MLASIIIPAYKPYTLLSQCLNSIAKNTDLSLVEIIVVCNGSDKESADLVTQFDGNIRLVWYKEALGFTKAANIGFGLASAPFTIIMNSDVVILDHYRNGWLDGFLAPFSNPKIGITGLSKMTSGWLKFFPFYCTAIRTSLFKEIGLLDLAFSPGYGEDIDFCIRTARAGYELYQIDDPVEDHELKMCISNFPVYHKGEGSFTDAALRNSYLVNANKLLTKKWGLEYPG